MKAKQQQKKLQTSGAVQKQITIFVKNTTCETLPNAVNGQIDEVDALATTRKITGDDCCNSWNISHEKEKKHKQINIPIVISLLGGLSGDLNSSSDSEKMRTLP